MTATEKWAKGWNTWLTENETHVAPEHVQDVLCHSGERCKLKRRFPTIFMHQTDKVLKLFNNSVDKTTGKQAHLHTLAQPFWKGVLPCLSKLPT